VGIMAQPAMPKHASRVDRNPNIPLSMEVRAM
jgi:hypothetical protein